jgi:SPP1 gp7 family putative phage head morphogenesis protein
MKNWSTRIYDALIWARIRIVWENEIDAIERIDDLTHDYTQRLKFHILSVPDIPGWTHRQQARWLVNRKLKGDLRRYSEECKNIVRQEATDAMRQLNRATKEAILGRRLTRVQEAAYSHTATVPPDDHEFNHNIEGAIPWQDISEAEYAEFLNSKFVGTHLEAWGETLATKELPAMADAYIQSMALGESMPQAAARLQAQFGFAKRSAVMMARTGIQAAANKMQERVYKDNSDIIKSLIFTATLDFGTCPVCGGYDNQEYPVNSSKPGIPVHPACRCSYVPRMKSLKELGLGPLDITDRRTRESMDGAVPGTKSYEDWINQPSIKKRFEAYKREQGRKAYKRKKARDAKRARDDKKLATVKKGGKRKPGERIKRKESVEV